MLIILNSKASKLCLKQIENGRARLIQNLDKQKSFLKNDRVYLKIKNKRGGGVGVRSPPNPWILTHIQVHVKSVHVSSPSFSPQTRLYYSLNAIMVEMFFLIIWMIYNDVKYK